MRETSSDGRLFSVFKIERVKYDLGVNLLLTGPICNTKWRFLRIRKTSSFSLEKDYLVSSFCLEKDRFNSDVKMFILPSE
jgi:hypothetical protein